MIYWLDKQGAEIVASLQGTPLGEFQWRKKPRWFQVDHDLAVNDFRLDMLKLVRKIWRSILKPGYPRVSSGHFLIGLNISTKIVGYPGKSAQMDLYVINALRDTLLI